MSNDAAILSALIGELSRGDISAVHYIAAHEQLSGATRVRLAELRAEMARQNSGAVDEVLELVREELAS